MENIYDLIIIGSGPAGLSAAIYMARSKYKTLVLEKNYTGGQITLTDEVINYPGVLSTNGFELTDTMYSQAKSFGAEFKSEEVVSLSLDGDVKEVNTRKNSYKAYSIIVATGANPRKLNFKGESEYTGRGVAYCATCDGQFYTGKDIFVVGGGYAACEEAMYLTKYGKSVTMIVRDDKLSAANSIVEKVLNHNPKIEIRYNTEVVSLEGDNTPKKITFKNNISNEISYYENLNDTFGTFIFAGYVPNTELLKGLVELDDYGYVITNEECETNIKGVYAAGDLRIKKLRQVVTAVADGAIAATSAEKVVEDLKYKLK